MKEEKWEHDALGTRYQKEYSDQTFKECKAYIECMEWYEPEKCLVKE